MVFATIKGMKPFLPACIIRNQYESFMTGRHFFRAGDGFYPTPKNDILLLATSSASIFRRKQIHGVDI